MPIAHLDDIVATPTQTASTADIQPKPARTWLDTVADLLPTIGGTAGAVVGGTPGSVVGGMAGQGYRVLAEKGSEIPAAVKDVLRNLVSQPAATIGGAVSGAEQGVRDAALQGATQGAANVVGNAVGAAAGRALQAAGPRLMQSALKPTKAVLNEYKTTPPAIVKTLLDSGVNVTQNGLATLNKLFDANNAEIKQALINRSDLLGKLGLPTAVIDKTVVASRALQTAGKIANQTNPTSDLKAIGDTVQEFVNHPVFKGNLTLPEAQAMKIGTYQQIGKKYGEMSSASVETQKAFARGLKEDIAAEVPQIADLNARDARLMAAMDAVGHRVALAGNRDPIGFAWVAHNPITFLAALLDRQPVIKSMLARGAYESAGAVAKVAPGLLRTAVAAIAQSGADALSGPPDAPASAPPAR